MLEWLSGAWQTLKRFVSQYLGTLIAWVQAGLSNTVDWLKSKSYELTNAINNGISWLKDRISSVAAQAHSDLLEWWNKVKATVSSAIEVAKNFATGLYGQAKDLAVSIRDNLQEKISSTVAWVKDLWSQVDALIDSAKAVVSEWVRAQFQNLKDWVDSGTANIRKYFDGLNAARTSEIAGVRGMLSVLLASVGVVPISLVWAYVESYFTEWFTWWLACLLWKGDEPLPKKPSLPEGDFTNGGSTIIEGKDGKDSFIWPTKSRYISGYQFNSTHKGVDIGINTGDAIVAIRSGTVKNAGWSDVGYGFMVRLVHEDGWGSLYAHLQAPTVTVGQEVLQGQIIGIGDSTGHSTGPHLHLEIYKGSTYFDPLLMLP